MEIRKARLEDLDRIVEIELENFFDRRSHSSLCF